MPEMSLRFSALKMPATRSTVVVVTNHSWSARLVTASSMPPTGVKKRSVP